LLHGGREVVELTGPRSTSAFGVVAEEQSR
jgi:hypothetical protein